jgi:serine/threonine-protein kinase RsbW
MEIKLTLALPHDEFSVPVARHVLAGALRTLGVEESAVTDIELALTEAATNVLDHATSSDEYEVSAGISGNICIIEVVDHGSGFDSNEHGLANADAGAETGRGVQLIRALVDRVSFRSVPQDGTVVHLEKVLDCPEGSTLDRMSLSESKYSPWSGPDGPRAE